MAVSYFGYNVTGALSTPIHSNHTHWYDDGGTNTPYICPGSGLQIVRSLGPNLSLVGTGNVRCAICTAAGALVMQWDNEYAPSGVGWFEKSTFIDSAGNPITTPTLTGGTVYLLMVTADGTAEQYYDTIGSAYGKVALFEYTGGFPASISGSGMTRHHCTRCGVEPAGSGGFCKNMISLFVEKNVLNGKK